MSLAHQKAEMRLEAARLRAEAHALIGPAPALATEALLDALGPAPGIVSAYLAIRTEIDPLPAMRALCARGVTVCVPVIEDRGLPLRFRDWTPEAELVPGPFGARVPAEGAWREPDALIVPLLAFDAKRFRLGYGGGYYDRTLAGLRARKAVRAIGFAFAAQEVPQVPRDATDARLDLVVTEAGPR